MGALVSVAVRVQVQDVDLRVVFEELRDEVVAEEAAASGYEDVAEGFFGDHCCCGRFWSDRSPSSY